MKRTIAQLAQQDPDVEVVLHCESGEVILSASEAVAAQLGHLKLDGGETCSAQLPMSDYNRIA